MKQLGLYAALIDLRAGKYVAWRPATGALWCAVSLIRESSVGDSFEAWVQYPQIQLPARRWRRLFYHNFIVGEFFELNLSVDHPVGLEALP